MPSCDLKNAINTPSAVIHVSRYPCRGLRFRSSRPHLRLRLLLLLHWSATWWRERCSRVWQVADRLDQPCFLVVELVVVRSICEEIGQELEQPLLVHDEELLHLVGLVGVGSENLASVD